MTRVTVDRIRCDGRGLCAELLPERITLDEWGYALVDDAPVEGAVAAYARTAVSQCPRLALSLVPSGATGVGPSTIDASTHG